MQRKQCKSGRVIISKSNHYRQLQINGIGQPPDQSKQPLQNRCITQSNEQDITQQFKIILEHQIRQMLNKINEIIESNDVDVRQAMNYVRSSILFKDIDEINSNVVNDIVGEYARSRIQELERSLRIKEEEVKGMRGEVNQEKQFGEGGIRNSNISIDASQINIYHSKKKGNSTHAQLLYQKAKNSNFQQFQQYCTQLTNQMNSGSLFNVKEAPTKQIVSKLRIKTLGSDRHSKCNEFLQSLIEANSSLTPQQKTNLTDYIAQSIKGCQQPCCKWSQSKQQPPHSLFNKTSSHRSNSFYKSDKIDEYYERYYHSGAVEVNKIMSLTKTNMQEMDKIYKKFKNKKIMGKSRHFRCQSIV